MKIQGKQFIQLYTIGRQKILWTGWLSVLFNWNEAKLVIEDSFRFNILTSISRFECTS